MKLAMTKQGGRGPRAQPPTERHFVDANCLFPLRHREENAGATRANSKNFFCFTALFSGLYRTSCSCKPESAVRSLPIFLDLSKGRVVVVGATPAASSKLETLRRRGADIAWHPVTLGREEAERRLSLRYDHVFRVVEGEPAERDLAGAAAVISAAGDQVDSRIAKCARGLGIPVNVVDRPELSNFIFPAIVDRGHVVVAVSTGGSIPVLARRLRERIEAVLPSRLGGLAEFLGRQRALLRGQRLPIASDRRFWEEIIDGPVAQHVMEGDLIAAEQLFDARKRLGGEQQTGSVALVGAGPGDPDLLTLKALRALQDADVIFYDALVSAEILSLARRDARKVPVGKRNGRPSEDQDEINRLLIAEARGGKRVVRLKGGDPFIFGRGGEELAALQEAGIAVSVVPGITAALGCSAEAELPLTFRDEATRLVVLTGHLAKKDTAIDWSGLDDPATTLVIYMGLTSAAAIRDGLIAAGRSPATPAAVLARGTCADSFAVAGPLAELPALVAQAGDGPALIVVGEVVVRSKPWRALVERAAQMIAEAA
jgi:uroporphyrin-III C-methyltransferase/precorrin-2 dehydrogenase/sirohydrochlorin ferrochelatase